MKVNKAFLLIILFLIFITSSLFISYLYGSYRRLSIDSFKDCEREISELQGRLDDLEYTIEDLKRKIRTLEFENLFKER